MHMSYVNDDQVAFQFIPRIVCGRVPRWLRAQNMNEHVSPLFPQFEIRTGSSPLQSNSEPDLSCIGARPALVEATNKHTCALCSLRHNSMIVSVTTPIQAGEILTARLLHLRATLGHYIVAFLERIHCLLFRVSLRVDLQDCAVPVFRNQMRTHFHGCSGKGRIGTV